MLWMIAAALTLSGSVRAQPLFQQKDIFISGLDGVVEYRIPALVTTDLGTLVAVCDARISKPGDAPNNIDLALKRSFDHGATWRPMRVIVDFPDEQAACDPALLVDRQTDTLWLIFDRIYPNMDAVRQAGAALPPGVRPGRKGRMVFLNLLRSQDDGQTWSALRDITTMVTKPGWAAVMALPGTGIQTGAGRLIFPCLSRRGIAGTATQDDWASLMYSDDHGKNWQLSSGVAGKTDEFHVVELVDSTLMVNLRHQFREKRYRLGARSADGGETWSDLVDQTDLIDPNCQGSFIRYTDRRDGYAKDRLLFANAASTKGRRNMSVRISYDEGNTWPVSKVVHAGPSAYSSMTILKDGTIGLLYESGQERPYEAITFARFNLEWLTDGEDSLKRSGLED